MIDVEQRGLRALEHHRLAAGHHRVQHQRHIRDPGPHPLAGRHHLIEHRLPVERGVLDDPVARADVLAHFVGQRRPIAEQIADTDATPPDLVLVGRSDAARCRADLALAASGLGEHIELAVIRQDHVRLLADLQPAVDSDAAARQLLDLREQGLRIDDHAVADETGDVRMQNAGRNQMQHELLAVHVHRVSGVVTALIPRDRRKVRRQHVDDLALALVAPLRTQNRDVRFHPAVYSTTKFTKMTKRTKELH